jgi:trk system potassium uptake protein
MASKRERILILGLGGVGFYLARRLSSDGYGVSVIEADPELIRRADGEIDARLIRGDAMSFACWREALAEPVDTLIAVTDNDAVNIMACRIASQAGIGTKIARVRTMELDSDGALLTPADLDIDLVIRPEEQTAQEISRLLKMRAGNVIIDMADGSMQVLATRIGESSALAGLTLKDISLQVSDFDFRIVAVARGIETIIPGGDLLVLPGDHVFIVARDRDLSRVMTLAGVSEDRRHRVMIIGGGLIGQRVAELLEDSFPVLLLERDEARAEQLTHELTRAEVLHGDGSDTATLLQAGLQDMDTIVTATGDNETNIMTAVLAKHLIRSKPGRKRSDGGKTIALVKREEYLVLASSMGADVVLNKKVVAGDEIFKTIRRGELLSVAHLHGCDAEVVELVAADDAPITGRPLYEVGDMKDRILIGAIRHRGNWQIAVGSSVVQPLDKVVAICRSQDLPLLEKLVLS